MLFSQFIIFESKKKFNTYSLGQNTSVYQISIGYNNTFISNTSYTNFLGLVVTNSLSWKDHVTQLIPKLGIKHAMYLDTADYVSGCIEVCILLIFSVP
jgi:hypothetical protein